MHLKAGGFDNAVYPYCTTKRFLADVAQDKIRKDKFRKINNTSFSYQYGVIDSTHREIWRDGFNSSQSVARWCYLFAKNGLVLLTPEEYDVIDLTHHEIWHKVWRNGVNSS